jgi:prephenate dehydrogenase
VDYIGGHPVVLQGAATSTPTLEFFRGALYCLVTTPTTRPNAIDLLETLVTAMGAKPYYIDADEHDAYIAGVEHLPVLASMALMETLSRSGGWREMQPIAGGAFRAGTALAERDPEVIRDACLANQGTTARWINDLIRVLVDMRDNLHHGEQLEAMLQHAHDAHRQWSAAQPNVRPGENELEVAREPASFGLSSLLLGRRKGRDKK